MRFSPLYLIAFLLSLSFPSFAHAKIKATINLSSQTMTVKVNGKTRYRWAISSGKSGFITPRGSFRPHAVEEMHYSKKYDLAPMPYSVFFNGGIAVHGTYATHKLGSPASHGCVRLSVGNARRFHDLILRVGKKNTRIKVVGRTPIYRVAKTPRKHKKRRRSRRHKRRYYEDDYYYRGGYQQGRVIYYDY